MNRQVEQTDTINGADWEDKAFVASGPTPGPRHLRIAFFRRRLTVGAGAYRPLVAVRRRGARRGYVETMGRAVGPTGAPVDLEKWRNTPVQEMPDWALINIILDRPVSPEEAAVLYEDEGFWRRVDEIAASAGEH